MKNICLGLTTAVVLLCSSAARAAEPPAVAPDRQELRSALTGRGWAITQDSAGQLTAERLYLKPNGVHGPRYAASLNTYARLQIYLQDDGRGHAAGTAYTSYCLYGRLNKSYLIYPPSPLRDPKLNQEYHEIVAEARSHAVAGASDKVAVR